MNDPAFSNDGILLAVAVGDEGKGHVKVMNWRDQQELTSLEASKIFMFSEQRHLPGQSVWEGGERCVA